MKTFDLKRWRPFFWYFGAWFLALLLYFFLRRFGTGNIFNMPELNEFFWNNIRLAVFYVFIESIIAALFYTKIAHFVFSWKFRRKSYLYIIAYFSGIHMLAFFVVAISAGTLANLIESPQYTYGEFMAMFLTHTELLVVFIYTLFIGDILIFATLISNRFGKGVLLNIMLGRYHQPQEQERIFMFLDLKSSTTYAERLGHVRYSEMIQDCFFDLTYSINKHDVEVYQYVGDEAILTWNIEEGIRNNNCIETFYTFRDIIDRRRDYYIEKYGFVPEFKAGINMGKVTVAEVGIIKREIAYHSDVLNTAARIQSKCNEFGQSILVSGVLRERVKSTVGLVTELMGNIVLKGKAVTVDIYAVRKSWENNLVKGSVGG